MLDFVELLKKTKNKNVEFYYKLLNVKDLPDDIKERCYFKLMENPLWAYCLIDINGVPDHIKRRAEEKCCEDPYWAFHLRRTIKDLSEDIKRRGEEKCKRIEKKNPKERVK